MTLPTLEPNSVQACVTSPPYYGLRDYGTDPLVWGGDAEHTHEWGDEVVREFGRPQGKTGDRATRTYTSHGYAVDSICPCGAWLGNLGLEPTPDLFVEHLVEVFREVRRVLRDDGVLWLNLGDSYAGSGKGPSGSNGIDGQSERQGWTGSRRQPTSTQGSNVPSGWSTRNSDVRSPGVQGLKPKDLMMMPFRVAMALQADGWWLRSVIPWLKRNSMPESVTDRPATSLEYVFLLAKNARYYWDAEAVRVAASENTHSRGNGMGPKQTATAFGSGVKNNNDFGAAIHGYVPNRNRRNSDWFFESWQGLLLDEQDDPLALVVNPAPFSGSHFATFPPKLVEPMIKASTRPGDTVLDPFGGAGTVGLVADRLQRNAILCELKPDYGEMSTQRITNDAPLFTEVDGGGELVQPEPLVDKQAASGLRRYAGFNARWNAKEAAE